MQILTASHLGMCFGVRDAIHITRNLERPADITINGQLVHNPLVSAELKTRGFTIAEESSPDLPATTHVLITAHGISNARRGQLTDAGKIIIDTTCPLVKKAHHAALHLESESFHLLVIAKKNHVETCGLTGDLASFTILENLADIQMWPHKKLGLIAQTTSLESHAAQIVAEVRRQNPHALIRFINTICQPTRDRQRALESLLQQIDVLVVVGGRNSNNTQHLLHRAHEQKIPALHIEHPTELHPSQFIPTQTVGLTAGTSTLPETIEQVHRRLESMFSTRAAK